MFRPDPEGPVRLEVSRTLGALYSGCMPKSEKKSTSFFGAVEAVQGPTADLAELAELAELAATARFAVVSRLRLTSTLCDFTDPPWLPVVPKSSSKK